jgi:hypothetical protein
VPVVGVGVGEAAVVGVPGIGDAAVVGVSAPVLGVANENDEEDLDLEKANNLVIDFILNLISL